MAPLAFWQSAQASLKATAEPERSPKPEVDALGLSPRQLEVLRLLIEGAPNKRICRELSLAESTVKTHMQEIFRRLDVNNRTQAVIAAAKMGLLLAG